MQTSNTDAGEPAVSNPRDSIEQTYLRVIENSFQEDRPQIKLVNFGTGSGKTHQLFQAVCETIRKYPDHQIIGLYVAPLREHLKVPFEVKRDNPGINFYVLYSQEWRIGEDFLKKYKQYIPITQKNKKLWDTLRKENTQDKVLEARQNLENVLKAISRYEFLQRADFGDSKLVSSETIKAQRDINGLMEKFLETLIKSQPDEDQWTDECRWLVEVFFPLHYLRKKSGFLMLTYEKFETRIPYFDYNGVKWVRKNDYLD